MAKSDVLVRMKADTTGYDANIAKARRQLDQFKRDNLSMGGVIKQLNGNLLATATRFASVTAAVGALGAAFRSNIETARGFEKSMSQLSSLTGMVGDDLNKLKEYSIELGSSTTLSASQVADAFKMIGSQQPQLLASGEALKSVTKNAITLAEAAGIELADAAKTLSVSINQMGGDSQNAERYINVLAAASQKGAGDIVWLGEAITKSGTTAKAVGTDYEELVANLEQLAKAGYDASTAGTALRSIIMNLEKQANQDYKPSVVGLTQAFENLGNANLTLTEYQGIAGKMFAAQAKALADAAGEAKNMKEEITGTNIAEDQAKTNTDNLDGSLKSLSSAWEGLNLHINSSNGFLRDCVDWLKEVVTWADNAYQSFDRWYKSVPDNAGDIITRSKNNIMSDDIDDNGNYIRKNAIASIPEIVVSGSRKGGGGSGKGGKGGSKTQKTLEQENNEQIQKLTNEYIKASEERQAAIRDEIKTLQERNAVIQQMRDEAQGKYTPTGKIEMENVLPMNLSGAGNPMEKYKDTIISIKTPLQELTDEMTRLQEAQALALSPEAWQSFQKQIEATQGKIDVFKGIKKDADESSKSFRKAASAVQSVGSAMQSIEDPSAKIMGIIAQAIANIALAFSKADVKEGESGNIWYWIAATATGVTTMISTIASIKSATGYANGGVIKGNSYSGDNIGGLVDGSQFVGLNAGEVVLNASQQQNLASNLQGSGGGKMEIVGVLTGENVVLMADRWGRRTGRGELLFGKNL